MARMAILLPIENLFHQSEIGVIIGVIFLIITHPSFKWKSNSLCLMVSLKTISEPVSVVSFPRLELLNFLKLP